MDCYNNTVLKCPVQPIQTCAVQYVQLNLILAQNNFPFGNIFCTSHSFQMQEKDPMWKISQKICTENPIHDFLTNRIVLQRAHFCQLVNKQLRGFGAKCKTGNKETRQRSRSKLHSGKCSRMETQPHPDRGDSFLSVFLHICSVSCCPQCGQIKIVVWDKRVHFDQIVLTCKAWHPKKNVWSP